MNMRRPGAPLPLNLPFPPGAWLWEKVFCLEIALGVSSTLRTGDARGMMGAVFAATGLLFLLPRRTTERLPSLSRRPPSYHRFLARRVGAPHRPFVLLYRSFIRPLLAGSFGGFWQQWNPPYGYLPLYYFYRPLRQRLPRPVARFLTFLASGFYLHDFPFTLHLGLDRPQGPGAFPAVTLLFGIFGLLTFLSEGLGVDLTRQPPAVRIAANLAWLTLGFGLRAGLLALWSR